MYVHHTKTAYVQSVVHGHLVYIFGTWTVTIELYINTEHIKTGYVRSVVDTLNSIAIRRQRNAPINARIMPICSPAIE